MNQAASRPQSLQYCNLDYSSLRLPKCSSEGFSIVVLEPPLKKHHYSEHKEIPGFGLFPRSIR